MQDVGKQDFIRTRLKAILGGHPELYYCHYILKQLDKGNMQDGYRYPCLHQDRPPQKNGRAVKVGCFLSDVKYPWCGNTYVVPSSVNELHSPDPSRAIPILGLRGDVLIYDTELWHSGSKNFGITPKVAFFFSYFRPESA